LGEVLRDSLTSGGVLILVEDVAELLLCAVDAGEEEERGFSLRTNFKATETVSGFGLGCVWAVLACYGAGPGLLLGCTAR
jgi:hypothetical protein